MRNPVAEGKKECEKLLVAAVKRCMEEGLLEKGEIPPFTVEIPADSAHGDFAANIAMVSARTFKKAPKVIAQQIVSKLELAGTDFSSVEVAGPGFINFTLGSRWFSDVLDTVKTEGENYGKTAYGEGKRILVEFVSANPTGPMHIGNARGGAIGDTLASVLEWSGHYVEREFYINDAGNQINKFAVSLDARYRQLYDDTVEMPEDAYLGADIIEHAKNFAALYGDSFLTKPEEERKNALVEFALPKNIQGLKDDLLRYRISYDNWFKESSLHESGEARKMVDLLTEKGYTYESEGAVWFKATEFGADKDFVLVRSNGFLTYVVPDIAYHYNKLVTRGFDKAIDVLGADHHGYVPRLKAALQALGIDPDRLDVVLMQMVRLVRNGETVKLSKRSGKAITLVTLLDEVPIDAARFYFNLREANSQFDFDLDLAVEQSSQNPVYYVQYAHARICSLFSRIREEGVVYKGEGNAARLTAPEELALIRHIARFPQEIVDAANHYDPARMTRYAIELATLFHKFYNACKVMIPTDEELTGARLYLCDSVRRVLKNVLALLKIDAPEKM